MTSGALETATTTIVSTDELAAASSALRSSSCGYARTARTHAPRVRTHLWLRTHLTVSREQLHR